MLVQSIDRYAKVENKFPVVVSLIGANKPMGKLEFAQFLTALDVKAGDFVCYKTSEPPYKPYQISRVEHVDEIHRFVNDWGNEHSGPMLYTLRGFTQKTTWRAGTKNWVKVPLSLVPKEWLEEGA